MTTLVGNDLIALDAAHNLGRADQTRLLERVLGAAERRWLAVEGSGDAGFAMLWSAKEAAFKALRKYRPGQVFAPRRWEVCVGDPNPAGERRGQVVVDSLTRLSVRWRRDCHWLHCIALLGPAPARLDSAVWLIRDCGPPAPFSARERAGFHSGESAAVRWLAKRLLHQRGLDEVEIVRDRDGRSLRPPRALRAGVAVPGVDLSLSHDGDYVASVIALSA
jgi:phosphopantetheinyl transferase (holo-ACP synthase)